MSQMVCVLFLLAQSAAVTGEIQTRDGSPARFARVAAISVSDPSTLARVTETDGAGHYRLVEILPGRYYILAGILERASYYPGVADLQSATVVNLTADSVTSLNFQLVQAAGSRVSGRVVEGAGRARNLTLSSVGGGETLTRSATVQADGSFQFLRVPPGTYSMQSDSRDIVWTSQPLIVEDREISDLELRLSPSISVTGRAEVDGDGPLPQIAFSLQGPQGWTAARAGVLSQRDKTFVAVLPVGEYEVRPELLTPGYRLDALNYQAADLMKSPLRASGEIGQLFAHFSIDGDTPWIRIRGRVSGLDNLPPGPGPLRVSLGSETLGSMDAILAADGSFEFPKVLPGTYRIFPPGLIPLPIVAGSANIDDMDFSIPKFFELKGRVAMEDGSAIPESFDVTLISATGGSDWYVGRTPDGQLNAQVHEGEYRVRVRVPPAYAVSSIRQGSQDLTEVPLRVRGDAESVSVTLRGQKKTYFNVSGRILGDIPEGLFGTAWQVQLSGEGIRRSAPVTLESEFTFTQVPPGEYKLDFAGFSTQSIGVMDRDVTGIELRPLKQVHVKTELIVEDEELSPQFRLRFRPAEQSAGLGLVDLFPGGSAWVPDGAYRLMSDDLPLDYIIKSITYGSDDVLNGLLKVDSAHPSGPPLVITLSLDPGLSRPKVAGRLLSRDPGTHKLHLISYSGDGLSFEVSANPDGSFEFPGVSPGVYNLNAESPPSGKTIVVEDRDVTGVEISIPELREIRGRIAVQDGSSVPSFGLSAWINAASGQPRPGGLSPGSGSPVPLDIHPDGEFSFKLPEGRHRIEVNGFPGSYYRTTTVTFGDEDALTGALTVAGEPLPELAIILETTRPQAMGGVRGTVTGLSNLSQPVHAALLQETSLQQRPVPVFRTEIAADGLFEFSRIPPGTYILGTEPEVAGMVRDRVVVGEGLVSEREIVVPTLRPLTIRTLTQDGVASPASFNVRLKLNGEDAYRVYRGPAFAFVMPAWFKCIEDTCGNAPPGSQLNEPRPMLETMTATSFTLLLPEGEHNLAFDGLPAGYRLKSAMYGSQDLLQNTLRIADEPSEILLEFEGR